MLGMEADEHLAEANVYVCELHNVLLGCVSFCVDFSAFVVYYQYSPFSSTHFLLTLFPTKLGLAARVSVATGNTLQSLKC